MSRKIILIKQELLLLVYELNRSGLLAERSEERFSRNAETDLVCRLLLEKKKNISAASARPSMRAGGPEGTWALAGARAGCPCRARYRPRLSGPCRPSARATVSPS